MRQPEIYTANQIVLWENAVEVPNGYWIPARPEGHNLYSFWRRLKTAYMVFSGKADALVWDMA